MNVHISITVRMWLQKAINLFRISANGSISLKSITMSGGKHLIWINCRFRVSLRFKSFESEFPGTLLNFQLRVWTAQQLKCKLLKNVSREKVTTIIITVYSPVGKKFIRNSKMALNGCCHQQTSSWTHPMISWQIWFIN